MGIQQCTVGGERDRDFEKEMRSNFTFFGTRLGFGTEYFFSNNFSIGGEFGYNSIYHKIENKDVDYDRWNDIYEEYVFTLKTKLGITRSALTLNFYF
ncbi:hypothetical protein CHISP_1201 [Chitinispirillum alkaliphilum]|nr:hypothetical protein CHISP_1201 [Chitinispirillum alkaliphilum]